MLPIRPRGRIKQIRMVAGIVRKANPKALPIVIGTGIGIIAIVVVIAVLIGLYFLIPLGVLGGIAAAMILFGRFAQSAQYAAIAGQPGAAAAILQSMRGNWTVTPAIAANRNMDVVHRAVGKPGVILVGEGSPNRLPEPAGRGEEAGLPGRLRRADLRRSRSATRKARSRSGSCSGTS